MAHRSSLGEVAVEHEFAAAGVAIFKVPPTAKLRFRIVANDLCVTGWVVANARSLFLAGIALGDLADPHLHRSGESGLVATALATGACNALTHGAGEKLVLHDGGLVHGVRSENGVTGILSKLITPGVGAEARVPLFTHVVEGVEYTFAAGASVSGPDIST